MMQLTTLVKRPEYLVRAYITFATVSFLRHTRSTSRVMVRAQSKTINAGIKHGAVMTTQNRNTSIGQRTGGRNGVKFCHIPISYSKD